MMSCDFYQDRLSRWLDNELSADVAAKVLAHVESCATCSAEVEAWRRIDNLLAAPAQSPDISLAVLKAIREDHISAAWWLRIAAAAVVAIGLGLMAGLSLQPSVVASNGSPDPAVFEEIDRHFGQPAPAGFGDLLTDLTSLDKS